MYRQKGKDEENKETHRERQRIKRNQKEDKL